MFKVAFYFIIRRPPVSVPVILNEFLYLVYFSGSPSSGSGIVEIQVPHVLSFFAIELLGIIFTTFFGWSLCPFCEILYMIQRKVTSQSAITKRNLLLKKQKVILTLLWVIFLFSRKTLYTSVLFKTVVLPIRGYSPQTWNELLNTPNILLYSLPYYSELHSDEYDVVKNSSSIYEFQPRSAFENMHCSNQKIRYFDKYDRSELLCEYYRHNTGARSDYRREVKEPTKLQKSAIHLYSRFKIASAKIPCSDRSHWKLGLKPVHYLSTFDLHYALKLISECNATAFVETEDNFKLMINSVFPKRSYRRNMEIIKSRDTLKGPFVKLHYKKRINPLFDLVVDRSVEQGIYKYWDRKFTYAKMLLNNIWGGNQTHDYPEVRLILSKLFTCFEAMMISAIVIFWVEFVKKNFKSFKYSLRLLVGLLKSYKCLYSYDNLEIVNIENRYIFSNRV